MLHTALLAVAAWLSFGNSRALTCHCLNNAPCDPADGSCPDGCEKGWYGPGCQLGNLALRKPAFQSSTYLQYTADYAVNGIMPPQGDTSEWNCSHTGQASTGVLWWYVDLSDSEDFVIKNITIVNRQGVISEVLRNFYILYTSNPVTEPDPNTWERCTFQKESQFTTVATYTCENRTAIGRRVAVYLITMSLYINMLMLCEVYVDGYSYDASGLQLLNTSVRTGCENFQMNFSTLSIVPPTYLLVQLRNNDCGNVTVIAIIRYTGTSLNSVTIRAMANGTYAVFVAPETCCIGSQCLTESTLDHSKCIVGQRTPPVLVTMPLYTKYALQKNGNVVNIATVNASPCSSLMTRVTCFQSDDAKRSFVKCLSYISCILDPRFGYMCVLDVLFSDGFTQTSQEEFNISTADFSRVTLSETITCNAITLLIENVTEQWDLEPSFIEFYLSSTEKNDSKSYRVPARNTGKFSATFSVMPNSSYFVWAVPVTYWGITPAVLNGSCSDSSNCIAGKGTPVKVITTVQRHYLLKTQGCCASIADALSVPKEKTAIHNVTCTRQDNGTYEVLQNENGFMCGLKPRTCYTCRYSTYAAGGILETQSRFFETGTEIDCSSSLELENLSAKVAGALTGIFLLIAVIVAVPVLRRRMLARREQSARIPLATVSQRNADTTNNDDGTLYANACMTREQPALSAMSQCASKPTNLPVYYNGGTSYHADNGDGSGKNEAGVFVLSLPEENGQYESLKTSKDCGNDRDYAVLDRNK